MDNIKESILKKRAFTIIEIMVSVAIISIISVGMLAIIVRSMHAYYTLSALNELNNNASFAIDEIIKDLRESKLDTINIDQRQDPATGHWHDIIVFASARDRDDPDTGEDESLFQYDRGTGIPLWISAIIYYPFTTQDGIGQLRKYVYYHPDDLSTGDKRETLSEVDFSLDATVTENNISLFILEEGVSSPLHIFDRANDAERMLANFISTEDANSNQSLDANENDAQANLPMDNADRMLDTGADFRHLVIDQFGAKITRDNTTDILPSDTLTDTVSIKLFLEKPITQIGGAISRRVSMTLNSAATLRN